MQAIYVFAAATGLVTLVAFGVCLLFRRTLSALLAELCEGEVRGRFWTLFSGTCVVLATFFTAVLFAPDREAASGDTIELFGIFIGALRRGVFGLLGVLSVLGLVLTISVAAFNARRRRGPTAPLAS